MLKAEGKCGISAAIVADSIDDNGQRITTFQLRYPRFIHSELMTHRVFSRNASSSRAIPIGSMMKQVMDTPAMPIEWGANQRGMQAGKEIENKVRAQLVWKLAASSAVDSAMALQALGLHKQIVNRVLEPFQFMNTIVTATEYKNFFTLRCHPDAQPEIQELAGLMQSLMVISGPEVLGDGEWHTPYVDHSRDNGVLMYLPDIAPVSMELAHKISASCCAQVSYRNLDTSGEKAEAIYDKLVNSRPVHASPFEHVATPSDDASMWGNFRGWAQLRKYIELTSS